MLDDDQTRVLPVQGRYGVWLGLAALPPDAASLHALAAGIERLGFGALWLGGSWGEDLSVPAELLAGSSDLVVATSIANIWRDPAERVAASCTELAGRYPGRFVLGVGVGHAPDVEKKYAARYERPLHALGQFLDVLDAAQPPVPVARRAVAALGPKALTLAADRSAGALPYLTTPEHTAQARRILGAGPFLAPEQKVVLSTDTDQARARARRVLAYYLRLPNYTNAWRRLGFTDDDVAGGGSDRLVDALFGYGTPAAARDRVQEHLAAGADHVCVQPVVADGSTVLRDLEVLATELF
jgi:probable F420-dependent oxidoreductase